MRNGIVNKLLSFRTEAQITQLELALAVGVTRQTIIALEKGNYVPTVALALKLAAHFKTPVENIFSIAKK